MAITFWSFLGGKRGYERVTVCSSQWEKAKPIGRCQCHGNGDGEGRGQNYGYVQQSPLLSDVEIARTEQGHP
jgi:hypothetical protein